MKHFCRGGWWSRVACLEMSLCLYEFILVNMFYIYLARVEGGYACAVYVPGGQMKTCRNWYPPSTVCYQIQVVRLRHCQFLSMNFKK